MSIAYVDTSVLAAIAFDEPGAAEHARRLDGFTRLLSSNLLEAEMRAAFAREKLYFRESTIAGIEWITPDRTLALEVAAVLETGDLPAAGLWHVATALFVFPYTGQFAFATLDARQTAVAEALGLPVPWKEDLP